MKKFKIRFTPEASRLLSKYHPENKMLIKQALNDLQQNPYIGNDLEEELYGFKSFKIKRYRIIYNIDEDINFVQIYYVGHRRDVYEKFRLLLNKLQESSS
ncbi:MAG: type II toxin-antitoxin system RelE/ParE family toxin [Deltaproteobacteria bacterium]|nr:type II toxin-antitoxin system RelE/ParE family toxin [Deltaproteobacteria bacterium]